MKNLDYIIVRTKRDVKKDSLLSELLNCDKLVKDSLKLIDKIYKCSLRSNATFFSFEEKKLDIDNIK